jgi:hypothetical protein
MSTHTTEFIKKLKEKKSLATASKTYLKQKFNLTDKDLITLKPIISQTAKEYRSSNTKQIVTAAKNDSILESNIDKKFLKVKSHKEWTNAKGEIQYATTFENSSNESLIETIEDIIEKKLKTVTSVKKINNLSTKSISHKAIFDRLVFTDVHIGMDISNKTNPIYEDLTWDKEELFRRRDIMIDFTINNKQSSTLLINDLGDFLDGYNQVTTRGGQKLPQKMSNTEAFEVGLDFKLGMIEEFVKHYENIIIINVSNSNHDGDYARILNSTFSKMVNTLYKDKVTVINQDKFIDIYKINKFTFCLTHGKDDSYMKFGLPAKLNPANLVKVTNMLVNLKAFDEEIHDVELSKGDSHLFLFDEASSDIFKYYNYPAFSPSSSWVQHNFNKGKSGFLFFNYGEHFKTQTPYFF